MSALYDAHRQVERLKRAAVPQPPTTVAETAEEGKTWLRVLLTEHGLDSDGEMDAIVRVDTELCDATLRNLLRLVQAGELDPALIPKVAHAAGLANGLAIGLTLAQEHDR